MAKANREAYKGEIKPVNRRGEPALGSRNTGHTDKLPTNQSRQDYDDQVRGVK